MSTAERETVAAVEELTGRSYVAEWCTLDGRPATIVARLERFGTVVAPGGVRVEFAWSTIARIMQHHGGRFSS